MVAQPKIRRHSVGWLGHHGYVIKCRRAVLARRTGITLRHQEPAAAKERHAEYRATKRNRPAERVMFCKNPSLLFRHSSRSYFAEDKEQTMATATKSTVIKIKVNFQLNTPNGLRRVIFGLEKDTQGDVVSWAINFQLFERAKKSDPFGDPIVSLDVDVDKALNSKAEKASKDGLTSDQSAHAIGPAADDAKAAQDGELKPSIAKQTVQDTIA